MKAMFSFRSKYSKHSEHVGRATYSGRSVYSSSVARLLCVFRMGYAHVWFFLGVLVMCFLWAWNTQAEMSTSNFRITRDVIGSFGTNDESANFKIGDTGGEVATGPADAVNFKLNAGFWQATRETPLLQFSVSDSQVDLGTLTSSSSGFDTAVFTVSTNAPGGYVVEYFGQTLESDGNTIAPMFPAAISIFGNAQFGCNVVDNAFPNVGSDPSGGSGVAVGGYSVADFFTFQSGDVIAESLTDSLDTTFTLSCVANVDSITPAGDYRTTLTLVATGRF